MRIMIRLASIRKGSRAKAKARKEKATENVKLSEPPGISREITLNPTRVRANAKDSKDNLTIAEKLDIRPEIAPRAKEMQK